MAKKPRPSGSSPPEPTELWDRMAEEGVQQYEKFCAYRDMRYTTPTKAGELPKLDITRDRSIRGLAKALDMSRKALEPLSVQFRWVERCEAYDEYILRRLKERNEADIIKMHETHAAIASQMLTKALRRLLTIPDEAISAGDLVRLVDIGVKVECLSRGESTERREISGEVTAHTKESLDLSDLTDDDLRRLASMAQPSGDANGNGV